MSDDAKDLTPKRRLSEIATILARGYLRLTLKQAKDAPQKATRAEVTAPQILSESRRIPLDVVRTPRPHVVEVGENGEAT